MKKLMGWNKCYGCESFEEFIVYEETLDYSMYGTWNGKPMLPSYNREERRKYIKKHKHNKDATNCIYCNAKTMTITDDNGEFVCELCGRFKAKKVDIKLGDDDRE